MWSCLLTEFCHRGGHWWWCPPPSSCGCLRSSPSGAVASDPQHSENDIEDIQKLQAGPPLDEMSIPYIPRNLLHAIEYLHSEGLVWNRGPQVKASGQWSRQQLNQMADWSLMLG
ncbi:uncharacterized protein [Zea mays]|uniref:Uncharacterized protein n=1 Tax=Zea mays TaxID=4577 RepID=A0A1D6FJ74_MAIZE|nr:uncharacterized protein LOC100275003 [Zea mays]AQK91810.1 hypothetical protein ZEAMMB73_Zm00001d009394 [Zea mays]AQK91811.1 hypothetical protein ZEAMMB73_Zm00001d009394 [Zea mays]|eukprot:XP_008655979.1 uncharacterized protein LOC100275003 [Zea mays]